MQAEHVETDASTSAQTEVDPMAFGWRIAVWLLGLGCGSWLALSDQIALAVAGVAVLGLFFAHGVELQHQALHNTGFRTPSANSFWGVLLGLPMLVSFYEYRINHLRHHAKIGTPEDQEFFDYGAQEVFSIKNLALRFLLLKHYHNFIRSLFYTILNRDIPGYAPRHQRQIVMFYIYAMAAITALVYASIAGGTVRPILIWLVALVAVASPVHALIEMPEHFGCDGSTPNVFRNTRTIRSNRFLTWFTNSNNFHVEHHYRPGIPMHRLRAFHPKVRERQHNFNNTYLEFFREALSRGPARRNVVATSVEVNEG